MYHQSFSHHGVSLRDKFKAELDSSVKQGIIIIHPKTHLMNELICILLWIFQMLGNWTYSYERLLEI